MWQFVSSKQVAEAFHSRFSAIDRFYRYRILTGLAIRSGRGLCMSTAVRWMSPPCKGPQGLVGDHDFKAFTEELDPGVENTRRTSVFRRCAPGPRRGVGGRRRYGLSFAE